MINLRFHIVSITAVFLALGLGVLMGTTVIDQGVVKALEARINAANSRGDRLEETTADLQAELQLWQRFGDGIVPALMRGRLATRAVTIVTAGDVEDGFVDGIGDAIAAAGGSRAGRVVLDEKWSLSDEASVERLALALDMTPDDADALLARAADRLAVRLGTPADVRADSDLLRRLAEGGFLQVEGAPRGPFPPQGGLIVLALPAAGRALPQPPDFLTALVGRLSVGRRLVVAAPLDSDRTLLQRIRGDDDLSQAVGTVDHADTAPGTLALVFALAQMVGGDTHHYGVERGAEAVAPALDIAPASPSPVPSPSPTASA